MAGSAPPGKPGEDGGHGAVIFVVALPDQRHNDAGPARQEPAPGRRWRAAAAAVVVALAALAVAGRHCYGVMYSSPEEVLAAAGSSSFLLPLHPKKAGARDSSPALPAERKYYTSVNIGNPAIPYFLAIDTGTDLTWIQCDAPCTNCTTGPHPLYKPAKQNLVHPRDSLCQELQGNQNYCDTCKQCEYEIAYADRSSSAGVLARDTMQLTTADDERENLDIVFGCAYDQQGKLLDSPASTDGVLGLSNGAISLPSQLASKGVISNVFGHCIPTDPGSSGYMFLGDDYIPRWGMTWVPIRNGPEYVSLLFFEDQFHVWQPFLLRIPIRGIIFSRYDMLCLRQIFENLNQFQSLSTLKLKMENFPMLLCKAACIPSNICIGCHKTRDHNSQ